MTATTEATTEPAAEPMVDIGTLIESTPNIRGGRPCLAGTGIMVRNIVVWHQVWDWTPTAIVKQYPHLTLAKVHAALAYYYANREKLDAQFAAEEEEEDRLEEEYIAEHGALAAKQKE